MDHIRMLPENYPIVSAYYFIPLSVMSDLFVHHSTGSSEFNQRHMARNSSLLVNAVMNILLKG